MLPSYFLYLLTTTTEHNISSDNKCTVIFLGSILRSDCKNILMKNRNSLTLAGWITIYIRCYFTQVYTSIHATTFQYFSVIFAFLLYIFFRFFASFWSPSVNIHNEDFLTLHVILNLNEIVRMATRIKQSKVHTKFRFAPMQLRFSNIYCDCNSKKPLLK